MTGFLPHGTAIAAPIINSSSPSESGISPSEFFKAIFRSFFF